MPGDYGDEAASSEIRSIFRELIAFGMDSSLVCGVGDADIDAMARSQNVSEIPASLREVYRLIGCRADKFNIIGSFSVAGLDDAAKRIALESVEEIPAGDSPLKDPGNLFVAVSYQGEWSIVVDGADLSHPNPPMWGVSESGMIVAYESVTSFFRGCAVEIKNSVDRQQSRTRNF
ncbi:hypothetical protein [Nocardia bovistercoris]|uniref:SMI1/KNR4 family protein n=1 Tax=Nocardia bovistercoris TaxID=2785916 RepID=A0A931IAP3_9NOCA|nr:hypothetical protein [Nocardia bovistercoris]MBH0776998.1 hypothetical protein [Nocardia bovistercoris]